MTLRDNLDGEYASEGLEHIDEAPDAAAAGARRSPRFSGSSWNWDQLMAWRREQRENERLDQRVQQAVASVEADQARIARVKFEQARALVHDAQDDLRAPAARAGEVQSACAQARPRPRARGRAPHRAALAQRHSRWQRGRGLRARRGRRGY